MNNTNLARQFTVHVPDEALRDLLRRLENTRWPGSLDSRSWNDGTSLIFLQEIISYWRSEYDWRDHERRINQLSNCMMSIDDLDVHFVHQKGRGPAPVPLLLTHGWPGSFLEMLEIVPMLTDPASHGGDPGDAFDVVVPSLPGFGFSQAPTRTGISSRSIAQTWRQLMRGLGYQQFGAQAGDIGAGVSIWLARDYPDSVVGVHLNYVPASFCPAVAASCPMTEQEHQFESARSAFALEEGAYAALQATKPQTLAYAMTDSPVGLAAWMLEKFHNWAGEEWRLPMDLILTNICLHWFGRTLESAFRLYKENRMQPLAFDHDEWVDVPFGIALFPQELPMPPRSWVERALRVDRWTQMAAGGHFAALEQPADLVNDIREFFRPLRSRLSGI